MPGAEAVLDSRAMELELKSRKQQRLQPADDAGHSEQTGKVQSRQFEITKNTNLSDKRAARAMQKADRADVNRINRTKGGRTISQMQNADRAQKNLKKGHPAETAAETAKDIAATGLKAASSWSLTTFWGSVWLDWTLLSLLYLNVHMFASLLLPKNVCQLGEDYLFGKWLPEKNLAKIFEIILIVAIDVLILTVIGAVLYGIYYLIYEISYWDALRGAVTPGVSMQEAVIEGALK